MSTHDIADFAEAFARWEQRYRDNRPTFMTPEECAAMKVADLAQQNAIYFAAILRELDDERVSKEAHQ